MASVGLEIRREGERFMKGLNTTKRRSKRLWGRIIRAGGGDITTIGILTQTKITAT